MFDAVAGGVQGILGGIGQTAKDIRSAVTGENPKLEEMAMQIEAAGMQAQTEVNKEEAKHQSIWVSGWRPCIGWICGVAIGWHFIISPLLTWIVKLAGSEISPPTIDAGTLMSLVVSLLGLGAYRTFEKTKGVQGKH